MPIRVILWFPSMFWEGEWSKEAEILRVWFLRASAPRPGPGFPFSTASLLHPVVHIPGPCSPVKSYVCGGSLGIEIGQWRSDCKRHWRKEVRAWLPGLFHPVYSVTWGLAHSIPLSVSSHPEGRGTCSCPLSGLYEKELHPLGLVYWDFFKTAGVWASASQS